MCPGFLHLKHTKYFFSSYLSLSPWDEDSFLEKSLLKANLLPLTLSPLMNYLLNFLVMKAKSLSSSLCFSSSTSSSYLVVTLRDMFFFFLSSPSCCFFVKLISYVTNDLWAPPKVAWLSLCFLNCSDLCMPL